MALKPCSECGREVSTLARQCPHCGTPYPADPVTGCFATMRACGCLLGTLMWLPLLLALCVGGG